MNLQLPVVRIRMILFCFQIQGPLGLSTQQITKALRGQLSQLSNTTQKKPIQQINLSLCVPLCFGHKLVEITEFQLVPLY